MNAMDKEARSGHPAPRLFFLPETEGMADSLTADGVTSAGGAHPGRWLADMAQAIAPIHPDARPAVPSVLAVEDRLCRALTHPASAVDQALTDAWRGYLAVALLWDTWAEEDCPAMTVETFDMGGSAFAAAASGNASRPLRVLTLRRDTGDVPLGLIGSTALLTPPATPADLSAALPARVRWYDRETHRMADPCPYLGDSDRQRLTARLRALSGLPTATASLTAFIDELTTAGSAEAEALTREDEETVAALEVRVKAVCGLLGSPDFPMLTRRVDGYRADGKQNPLLCALLPDASADASPLPPQVTYLWRGIPFAQESAACGLVGTHHPREAEAIREIGGELTLLEDDDPAWNRRLSDELAAWPHRHDAPPDVKTLVAAWQAEAAARGAGDEATPLLSYPWPEDSGAVRLLLRRALGEGLEAQACSPFADRLCVMENAPEDALGDMTLNRICRLPVAPDKPAAVVIPPLSATVTQLLAEQDDSDAPDKPIIAGMQFERGMAGDSAAIRATVTLRGRSKISLRRVYPAAEWAMIDGTDAPTVAVWPSLPLPPHRWTAYYTYAHRASDIDVLALRDGAWQSGVHHNEDGWQTILTPHFPAYLLLKQGELTLGALPNLLSPYSLPVGEPAEAALDFGTTGTTVMLRLGDRVVPLHLERLQRTLLRGLEPAPLTDEFLPDVMLPPILPSAEEVFSDDPAQWQSSLTGGHIFLPDGVMAIHRKDASHLSYDLKWSTDPHRDQVNRLYLHQVMVLTALSALLQGAPSLVWRVALSEDMAEEGRAAFARLMASLTSAVAADTGMPLTPGLPAVSYAPESAAAGMYFRSRDEANIRGGFVTLDVGGGSAKLSLWLRGMDRPAAGCSLPMGAQFMLLDAFLAHPDRLAEDFGDGEDPAFTEALDALVQQLRVSRGSRRALQKSRLMLDMFLSTHLPALHQHMNKRLAVGRATYTQSLLLLSFAFLMLLSGLMQEQAFEDPLLNDLLPGYMEICLAGRGCLLMLGLADTLRVRLKRFIRLPMQASHPTREHLLLASAAPKREVATGLLRLESLTAAPPAREAASIPRRPSEADPMVLMQQFLALFRQEFPDAAYRLFPALYAENGASPLTKPAEKRLRAIIDAQFAADAPLPVRYAAVWAALRVDQDA